MGHVKDRWKDPARAGKNADQRYQAWLTVDGKETYAGAYRTRGIARRHLIEQEARAQRGDWIDTTDTTNVAEAARAFARTRPYGRSTTERVDGYIRNHLGNTELGALRLSRVRPSDVQMWVTDRSTKLAPTTLRALVKFVRAVFAAAVLDRQIGVSPFVRITLPRFEQEWDDPLTVDQVRALAAAMLPKYKAMALAQAGLGLRIGELLALRAEDISFLTRTARVEHQIDARTRERIPPKTPKSRRSIPMIDPVSEALAEHIRQFPPAPSGLLFHTRDGMPYWHEYYSSKVFAKAVIKAKLPAGTTPHALRHHFASTLIDQGESVITVAALLGHEDATQVIRVYGRRIPGSDERVRKSLQGAWSGLTDAPAAPATAQGRPQ